MEIEGYGNDLREIDLHNLSIKHKNDAEVLDLLDHIKHLDADRAVIIEAFDDYKHKVCVTCQELLKSLEEADEQGLQDAHINSDGKLTERFKKAELENMLETAVGLILGLELTLNEMVKDTE